MDESFAGDYAFRDAGSRFSVLKSPKTAAGPDECYGLFARDTRLLFRKLWGLEVAYAGLDADRQSRLTTYNAMNYYRSHVVEHFFHNGIEPMPPTEGECVFWFACTDVLCVRYRLVNKASRDVPVRLAWRSEGEPGETWTATATEQGWRFENTQSVGALRYVGRAELLAGDDDIVFEADANTLSSAPVDRVIPAHGQLECRFAVRFAFNDEAFPEWPAGLWSDADLQRAIAETEQAYAALPDLPESSSMHADLVLKAAGTLRSLRYRDRDAAGQPVMTIHAGKTGCGATWFWDSGVTLPALGYMQERETAAGTLRLLAEGIRDDGVPAVTYEHQQYAGHGYQFPILAWGAGHYLAASPDRRLLHDIYPPLARYVQGWLDRFLTPLGLVTHPEGCSCLDDALRWHTGFPLEPRPGQSWHGRSWGRMRAPDFLCPDINAFLVLELLTLGKMAQALGRAEEDTAWVARADALSAAINEHLIEPCSQTYQDRHVPTHAFTGMVHMGSFLPVYAGIAPTELAEHLCRDYLLSPDHFQTELPFPVVDRAHPTFRAGGFLHAPLEYPGALVQQSYWRGRTWLHADNWYLGALWRSGFQREADELADRILAAVSRTEGINECYDSLTGFGNGHPEFMWSAAAVLMMAHGFYRQNPIATLE